MSPDGQPPLVPDPIPQSYDHQEYGKEQGQVDDCIVGALLDAKLVPQWCQRGAFFEVGAFWLP